MATVQKVVPRTLPPARDPRVIAALQLLQHAQSIVARAAEQLCPVEGYCPEWEAVGLLYDQVKSTWHVVNRSA